MNFFLNSRLAARTHEENVLIAYPHAQRTGGVTMRKSVLAYLYGEEHVYNRHYVPDAKPWAKLTDHDLRGFRAWTDLNDYSEIGLARPVLWLALLRHPLYRTASLYFYVQGKEGHRDRELANRTNMEDFYRQASKRNPKYYRNLQCTRVCGRPDARLALETIEAKYVGVGFTNHLADFVGALGGVFGWPAIELKGKAPDDQFYGDTITPGFRDAVLEGNAEDLALFEAISKGAV